MRVLGEFLPLCIALNLRWNIDGTGTRGNIYIWYHGNLREAKLSVQCYIYPLFVRIHADPVPWQVPWQVSVLCHELTPMALASSVIVV
jgi:hypothetical protein